MNVETLINNDEHKIIFLKAILLGINYGKSDNSDFYINNIKNEINKIYNKLNHPEIIKYNNIIKKNEYQIINLEYQKGNILSNIQKLSHNNYGSNHSKINILKINVQNIQNEIERLKNNIKKNKDLKEKLMKNDNNFTLSNSMKLTNNHIQKLNQYDNQQLNQYKDNKNIKIQNNSNLVGELEKTLDNLSNLFV
jgi:hypothetical protein